MSDADGFAALAAAAEAIKGVVSATVVMRCQWRDFDIRSAMIEFLIVIAHAWR